MTAFKIETLENGALVIEGLDKPLILTAKNGDFVTIHIQKDRILVGHETKVAECMDGKIEIYDLVNDTP